MKRYRKTGIRAIFIGYTSSSNYCFQHEKIQKDGHQDSSKLGGAGVQEGVGVTQESSDL